MPEEKDKEISDKDIDAILDNVSLRDLRKKYNVADSEVTFLEQPQIAKMNVRSQGLKHFSSKKKINNMQEDAVFVEPVPEKGESGNEENGFDAFPSFMDMSDFELPEIKVEISDLTLALDDILGAETGAIIESSSNQEVSSEHDNFDEAPSQKNSCENNSNKQEQVISEAEIPANPIPLQKEAAEQDIPVAVPAGGDDSSSSTAIENGHASSDDVNINAKTSAFRIIYQVPGTNDASVEQNKPRQINNTNEQANDFISNMRIIFEETEGTLGETRKDTPRKEINTAKEAITMTATENPETGPAGNSDPLSVSPQPSAEPSTEPLHKTGDDSTGFADLFAAVSEDAARVKKESAMKRVLKNVFPHKGDGFGEIVRKTVLIISLLTMFACIGILINTYIIAPYQSDIQSQQAVDLKTNTNIDDNFSTIKDKYPNVVFPTGIQLKFTELYVFNNDFAGWLEIPGTGVDMPIVKGADNFVYLKKSFYNKKSKYGCCFVDSSNNIAELDRNTIIYGHNMHYDELMFGKLEIYKNIDSFKAAPLITFNTLFKDTKWKIYAVFITNGVESGDNGYVFNYIFKNLSNDDFFSKYIAQIDQRKLYTTGVDILPTDKILTLSTCCYDFEDARLAVVARMVRDRESDTVDTSHAIITKSPRYPQAWYSAKGTSNPYKDAEKWVAS